MSLQSYKICIGFPVYVLLAQWRSCSLLSNGYNLHIIDWHGKQNAFSDNNKTEQKKSIQW